MPFFVTYYKLQLRRIVLNYLGSMFVWSGFFAGLGSVLSFGFAKKSSYPLVSSQKVTEDDWRRVAKDISLAIKNYKPEEKNGDGDA